MGAKELPVERTSSCRKDSVRQRLSGSAAGLASKAADHWRRREENFRSGEVPKWEQVGRRLPFTFGGCARTYVRWIKVSPILILFVAGGSLPSEPWIEHQVITTYLTLLSLALVLSLMPAFLVTWLMLKLILADSLNVREALRKLGDDVGRATALGLVLGGCAALPSLVQAGVGASVRTMDPLVAMASVSLLFATFGVLWSFASQVADVGQTCPTPAAAPFITAGFLWFCISKQQDILHCTPTTIQRGLATDKKAEILRWAGTRAGGAASDKQWNEILNGFSTSVPASWALWGATALVGVLTLKRIWRQEARLWRTRVEAEAESAT